MHDVNGFESISRWYPIKHFLQSPAPMVSLNLPASHVWHLVLPSPEEYPAGHATQAAPSVAVPSSFLLWRYRPGMQAAHGVPASPASHVEHLALPSSDLEPLPQESHVVEFACSLFVFLGHLLHDGCPGLFWYVPLRKMYREKADEERKIKLVNKKNKTNKTNHI